MPNLHEKIQRFITANAFTPPAEAAKEAHALIHELLTYADSSPPPLPHCGSTHNGTALANYPVFDFLLPLPRASARHISPVVPLARLLKNQTIPHEFTTIGVVANLEDYFIGIIPCIQQTPDQHAPVDLYFNDADTWRTANIPRHQQQLTLATQTTKDAIRLIKLWNESHSTPLESYHIEKILLPLNLAPLGWPCLLILLFDTLYESLEHLLLDDGIAIDTDLSPEERQRARTLCNFARDIARKAFMYDSLADENDPRAEKALATIFARKDFSDP